MSWQDHEFKEHNVVSGLGTLLAFMRSNETKYHALTAVESMPSVFGTPENMTFSSTTNINITNVEGKNSIENPEINLPYNLDNIVLMDSIAGEKIKFAYIDLNDFTAVKFTGTPRYRVADIGTDSVKMIVMTITVHDVESKVDRDVYDLFQDTITFDDNIPAVIKLTTGNTDGLEIAVATTPSTATFTTKADSEGIVTVTATGNKIKFVPVKAGSTIVNVQATDSTKNYASNERNIKVFVI